MSGKLTKIPAVELERSSWTDTSLIGLVIGDKEIPRSLQRACIGGEIRRTMKGASTITIVFHDEDGSLIASNTLQKGLPAKLYHEPFRVARISKQGKIVTVQMEDEAVWQLRQKKGLRVAAAGTTTRLQFANLLVSEIPELTFSVRNLYARPLLYEPPRAVSRVSRNGARGAASTPGVRGFSDGANFKIKGVKADNHQIYVIAEAMRTADRLITPRKARLALIEALIQESVCRNLTGGHSSSVGCLQLLDIHGSKTKRMNVAWCVEKFIVKGFTGAGGAHELARKNPSWKPGQVAQAVQGSAHPDRYEIHRAEAEVIYEEWTGAASGEAIAPTAATERRVRRAGPYMRKDDETSWDTLLRLGDEVNWRVFARGSVVFMYSDYDLLTSSPNATIRERDEGVLSLDFDVDDSKRIPDAARLRVIGERGVFLPGTVVVIKDAGAGDGRWIVSETSRSLVDQVLTVELARPESQKPEGAPAVPVQGRPGQRGSGPTRPPTRVGSLVFPVVGKYQRGGGVAAHNSRALGNWQSDNAVDIMCKAGTPVVAVEAGVISSRYGFGVGATSGTTAGFRLHLEGSSGEVYFYQHLGRTVPVKQGQRVRKGQVLGYVGDWSSFPNHLHFASMKNNPERLIGWS